MDGVWSEGVGDRLWVSKISPSRCPISKMASSGVIFAGIGERLGDREGICSFRKGCGESALVSGVGDFKEDIGEVIGVKCAVGDGTEFNNGDPKAMEDVSGADSVDREISEISDAGEGVAYAGFRFKGNSSRSGIIISAEFSGLLGKSFVGSGD